MNEARASLEIDDRPAEASRRAGGRRLHPEIAQAIHAMGTQPSRQCVSIRADSMVSALFHDRAGTVERIDRAFGQPLGDEAAQRMRTFVADDPRDKHAIHRYSPAAFGVEPGVFRAAFEPGMERFGLEPER